jgi:hypothetical protein
VGKRYRGIIGEDHTIKVTRIYNELELVTYNYEEDGSSGREDLDGFFSYYEELPDQAPKDHSPDIKKKVSDKVQEAMEELERVIKRGVSSDMYRSYNILEEKAENLIKAIEDDK